MATVPLTERAIVLRAEDDVASTAVFACIIMMQKDKVFVPRVPGPAKKA